MLDAVLELYNSSTINYWDMFDCVVLAYTNGIISKKEAHDCIKEIEKREELRLKTGVK